MPKHHGVLVSRVTLSNSRFILANPRVTLANLRVTPSNSRVNSQLFIKILKTWKIDWKNIAKSSLITREIHSLTREFHSLTPELHSQTQELTLYKNFKNLEN